MLLFTLPHMGHVLYLLGAQSYMKNYLNEKIGDHYPLLNHFQGMFDENGTKGIDVKGVNGENYIDGDTMFIEGFVQKDVKEFLVGFEKSEMFDRMMDKEPNLQDLKTSVYLKYDDSSKTLMIFNADNEIMGSKHFVLNPHKKFRIVVKRVGNGATFFFNGVKMTPKPVVADGEYHVLSFSDALKKLTKIHRHPLNSAQVPQ